MALFIHNPYSFGDQILLSDPTATARGSVCAAEPNASSPTASDSLLRASFSSDLSSYCPTVVEFITSEEVRPLAPIEHLRVDVFRRAHSADGCVSLVQRPASDEEITTEIMKKGQPAEVPEPTDHRSAVQKLNAILQYFHTEAITNPARCASLATECYQLLFMDYQHLTADTAQLDRLRRRLMLHVAELERIPLPRHKGKWVRNKRIANMMFLAHLFLNDVIGAEQVASCVTQMIQQGRSNSDTVQGAFSLELACRLLFTTCRKLDSLSKKWMDQLLSELIATAATQQRKKQTIVMALNVLHFRDRLM